MEDSYDFWKKRSGLVRYFEWASQNMTKWLCVGEGASCGAVVMQLPQTWAAAAALKMTYFHIFLM